MWRRVFSNIACGDAAETESEGRLVACCLTDILADGLSMVYSFYDPTSSIAPSEPS